MIRLKKNLDLEIDLSWFNYPFTRKGWVSDKFVKPIIKITAYGSKTIVDGFSLTNATDNRIVTSTGSTGLNCESNLTFDGNLLTVAGTNPQIRIGDDGAEDTSLVFKRANAQDFYMALDDTTDGDSQSSGTACYEGPLDVVVTCGGGSYPSEVSWNMFDYTGAVVLSGGAPFDGCLGDCSGGTDDGGAGECVDTDNGAVDPYGDGCAAYNAFPSWCGNYDDDDFFSLEM